MSANVGPTRKELYEFGPFRVDPEKEILLRDGEQVPLTPKTFQILLVLVRHSKEVVTKDDLMKTVWPDTFVEEANLSRNVFMLRKALGETPQDHRYIVTVPGRGYRLAEDVRSVSEEQVSIEQVSIVAATHSRVKVEVRQSWPWLWVAVVSVLVLVGGLAGYRYFHRAVVSPQGAIVLADFNNSTGDAVFDETLRQGTAVQLEQSPIFSIVTDEKIRQTLLRMGRSQDLRLTPGLATEICQRTGSAVVVEGSIASLGSQYVLGLRARDCLAGRILADQQQQAARKEDVLNTLGALVSGLRKQIGESITTLQRYDTPLADATTPSLEALKAYSSGLKALYTKGSAAAIPFFQRAVELDPQFAMAHAFLGRMYGDLGEFDLSAASTSKAYELRNHASDRERYFITVSYDAQVTGNLEKAEQICEAWKQAYPRDPIPHSMLSGIVLPAFGRYEQAAEEGRAAVERDPDFSISYAVLAFANQELGRYAETKAVFQLAADRNLDLPDFVVAQYDLAFLENDEASMQRLAALVNKQPGSAAWMLDHEAFVAAYHGHLRDAVKLAKRAAEATEQSEERERAAQFTAAIAIWQALFGDVAGARQSAKDAIKVSRDRDVEYGAAFALAWIGDSAQAKPLIADLEKRFPEDTSVRFSYLPVLQAVTHLNSHEPAKAVQDLQSTTEYELACPRSCQHGFYGAMYPIYVRGLAYEALNEPTLAAAEFRKILAHPGIIVSDPVSSLANRQLARSLAAAGDKAGAETAYRHFFTLWRDADPELPILKPAKSD
jgi:eukaryotic-like serine/threonine-protein kinase